MPARLGLALAALLAGCADSRNLERLYGGPANLEAIRSCQAVEVFRLRHPKTSEIPERDYLLYNRWPVVKGPILPEPKISGELLAALLDENTFCNWDEGKGCKPHPGVMIRFKGTETIDLMFCFECDMLLTFRGREPIWGANFDYSHNRLLSYFIAIFPDDPDLPKLLLKS